MENENVHTPSSVEDEKHADLISSPLPEAIPVQDSQDTKIDMTGPFESESIAHLPQLTIQQLSELEEQISGEFSALAFEYVVARKARLEYLQKSVETQIKKLQQHDVSWTSFYNKQVQQVQSLVNATENRVIKENSGRPQGKHLHDFSAEFDQEFEELIETLESPLEYDDIFSHRLDELPFAEYFREIVDLHRSQLKASSKQIEYSSSLIKSITEKNRVISWKQYRNDVMDYKDDLIKQTCEQLENLHKEYYGINEYGQLASANSHYYKSTVPVEMSETEMHPFQRLLSTKNHDKYHDSENVYYKKNKVEISDTKRDFQERYNEFLEQQGGYKIPQLDTVLVKLSGCVGITKEEGDYDLALLRRNRQDDTESLAGETSPSEEFESPSFDRDITYNSDEEDYRDVLGMGRRSMSIDQDSMHE